MKSWSEKLKNLTREKAGDGAMPGLPHLKYF